MTYILLFLEFFKIGLFAIGGGFATLPFLYNLADKYTWFDRGMLVDMIAISQSTPGPIGINMATYAGFNAAGISGGLVSSIALILPSLIIIIIIAKFLNKFSESPYIKWIFYSLRPAVTALIAVAGVEVVKTSVITYDKFASTHKLLDIINIKSAILLVILLYITTKFKKHPIFIIALAAVIGIIFKLQ